MKLAVFGQVVTGFGDAFDRVLYGTVNALSCITRTVLHTLYSSTRSGQFPESTLSSRISISGSLVYYLVQYYLDRQ